jgi:hypothetical protein
MKPEEEFTFNVSELCGEQEWRDFFRTHCWKEFCDTMQTRRIMHRNDLEVAPKESIASLQGQAMECRFVMEFEKLVMSEFIKPKQEEESDDTNSQ